MEKSVESSNHEEFADAAQTVSRGADDSKSQLDEEPKLHWRTWGVVVACGFLLFADNFGIVATGFFLTDIVGSIGGADVSIWFPDAPLVVQVALMPVLGLWADFGSQTRRWMSVSFALIAAVGLFVAGSAKTMQTGIIGTALFGPSIIMYFTCFAIASEVIPHRMRGVSQAMIYCLTALGAVIGDLAGGALIKRNAGGAGGWRWTLYLAGIFHVLAAISLLLLYRPLPSKQQHQESYLRRLARLDFLGCFLFAAGWVPLLVALISGGNVRPWKSASVIACLIVGVVFFVVFILHQIFVKKDGVLNHRLFSHRNFGIAMFGIFIEGWFLIPTNVFYGSMVTTMYETDPVLVGLHGAVLWAVSLASSAFCGWYSKRFRRVQELIIIGFLCILGAMIGLSTLTAKPSDNKTSYGMITLAGLGLGVQLTLLIAVAQLAVPKDLIGICSALFVGVRSCGAAICVAICSAVLTSKVTKNLPAAIAKAAQNANVSPSDIGTVVAAVASSDAATLQSLGLTAEQISAVQAGAVQGYAESYKYVWYVIMSGVCAILIAALFLKPVKAMMTWEIDNPVETDDDLGIHHYEKKPAPVA